MEYLLFNDTRSDVNPGCHATVGGLLSLYKENGLRMKQTFGRGYARNFFKKSVDDRPLERGPRLQNFFQLRPWKHRPRTFNLKAWREGVVNLMSSFDFQSHCKNSDIVIVNMEGTVHHNFPGAVTLLGIAKAAQELGTPVWMVNGSIQGMDHRILSEVLPGLEFLSVREPMTYNALKGDFPNIVQAADCAFLSRINEPLPNKLLLKQSEGKRCLYTPGVLALPNQAHSTTPDSVKRQINHLQKSAYEVTYLAMDEFKWMTNLGDIVDTVEMSEMTPGSIGSYMSQFDLIVTGRYHIAIFAAMQQIKFVPLPSNTWKVEAVLELLNAPFRPSYSENGFHCSINKVKQIDFSKVFEQANEAAPELAKKNYPHHSRL